MNKILRNLVYQGFFQLITIGAPVVILYVASTALGPSGLGLYTYIISIAQYFVLFAGLGLQTYGIREIARCRDNRQNLSRTFWELEICSVLPSSLAFLAFLILALFMGNESFYLISSLVVLAALFDISWFFSGVEDFRAITIASGGLKILTVLATFVLVHTPADLSIYFWIQSLSALLGQVVLWCFLVGRVSLVLPSLRDSFRHLRNAIRFFLLKISISLYTILLRVLLGILVSVSAVAIFANAYALASVAIGVIGVVDTVLLPRLSHMYSAGKEDEMKRITERVIHLQLYLTLPLCCGIGLVSSKVVPWFMGHGFEQVITVAPVLSLVVIIVPLGVTIARQLLIPIDRIRESNISLAAGAVVGVGIGLTLIPIMQVWGAVIAALAAESTVTGIRLILLRKLSSFHIDWSFLIRVAMCTVLMGAVVFFTTHALNASPMTALFQVLLGIAVYISTTILLHACPLVPLLQNWRSSKG